MVHRSNRWPPPAFILLRSDKAPSGPAARLINTNNTFGRMEADHDF
jgi:hypothetical protein